jgi:hypothetical protein
MESNSIIPNDVPENKASQQKAGVSTQQLMSRYLDISKRANEEGFFSPKKESITELDVLEQYIKQNTGIAKEKGKDGWIFSGFDHSKSLGYLSGLNFIEQSKALNSATELANRYGDSRSIAKLQNLGALLSTAKDENSINDSFFITDRLQKATQLGLTANQVIPNEYISYLESKTINEREYLAQNHGNFLTGMAKGVAGIPSQLLDFMLDTSSLLLLDKEDRWGTAITESLGLSPNDNEYYGHIAGNIGAMVALNMASMGGASALSLGGLAQATVDTGIMLGGSKLGETAGQSLGSITGNKELYGNVGALLGGIGAQKFNPLKGKFSLVSSTPKSSAPSITESLLDNSPEAIAESEAVLSKSKEALGKALSSVEESAKKILPVGYEKVVDFSSLSNEGMFNVDYKDISSQSIENMVSNELLKNEGQYLQSLEELNGTLEEFNSKASSEGVSINIKDLIEKMKDDNIKLNDTDKTIFKQYKNFDLANAIAESSANDSAFIKATEQLALENNQISSEVKNSILERQKLSKLAETNTFNSDLSVNTDTSNLASSAENAINSVQEGLSSEYKKAFSLVSEEIAKNKANQLQGSIEKKLSNPVVKEVQNTFKSIKRSRGLSVPFEKALNNIGMDFNKLNSYFEAIVENSENTYDFSRTLKQELIRPIEQSILESDSFGARTKMNALLGEIQSLDQSIAEASGVGEQLAEAKKSYAKFKEKGINFDKINIKDPSNFKEILDLTNEIKELPAKEKALKSLFEYRSKILGDKLSKFYENGSINYKKLANISPKEYGTLSDLLSSPEKAKLSQWIERSKAISGAEKLGRNIDITNLADSKSGATGKTLGKAKQMLGWFSRKWGIAGKVGSLFLNDLFNSSTGLPVAAQAELLTMMNKIFSNGALKLNLIEAIA